MIGRPGSIPWLFAAEARLALRDLFARRGRARAVLLGIVPLVLIGAVGIPVGLALRHVNVPLVPFAMVVVDLAMLAVFSLMLSQTLAAATQTLYVRGDLELLFSSPIPPRKVLAVRFAAIAGGVFAAFLGLVGPPLVPIAVLGHPEFLGVIPVLAGLALTASALGLLIAVALFRLIGPRRTRTVAQVLAALIGAAFFISSQIRNILGQRGMSNSLAMAHDLASQDLRLPAIAGWPLRAMLGDPLPMAVIFGTGLLLFVAVSQLLGARFAADASAASGADEGGKVKAPARVAFAAGAFAATVGKELRLLRRDAALLSQVFLRVLYLMPLAFVLVRNAGAHMTWMLPGGAAGLALLSGQVSGSLAWITISAEDAPDLLAASPTPIGVLLRAKLAAALTPVAVLLAIPLVALIVLAPAAGLAATAGCAASSVASGLINAWYNKPGKRADFRRRRGGSWAGGLAQLVVTFFIAGATGLLATGTPLFAALGLAPAAIAGAALLVLRRSDAQVAASLRAAA
ncbi:MAG TPA: hypothetical protein VG939_19180 [Caulobacteraceae bacterium]|nr:hypothetical protein [Caulobacteraceae bacterium]